MFRAQARRALDHRLPRTRRGGVMLLIVAAVAALVLLTLSPASTAAEAPDGGDPESRWMQFDGGQHLRPSDIDVHSIPHEQFIAYFTAEPAARWPTASIPVELCTHQANRPAGISADQFRSAVRDGAAMWNRVEAATALRYAGDCTSGSRWLEGNGANEVGFDDERNVVRGSAAGIALGTWLEYESSRELLEFEVVLDDELDVPEACFRSVTAHELGHVLGFGHSDVLGDLMYASFNPDELKTCPEEPSASERDRLVELYGANGAPVFHSFEEEQTAWAEESVRLSVDASDPEDDALSFEWTQIEGPDVDFTADGASISFVAPRAPGETIRFDVSVRDSYLHLAETTVSVHIDDSSSPPVTMPTLATIGARDDGASAELVWRSVEGAARYKFCSGAPGATVLIDCTSIDSPVVAASWPTVIDDEGDADARRVFTTGARQTSLAGCNAAGCSEASQGPLVGGLRWDHWDIGYDYIAMAFDVPGTGIRFTIGGVVNLDRVERRFTVYSGRDAESGQRLQGCGTVAPGGSCFSLLGVGEAGHDSHVTIVSQGGAGSPTTEHRIRVR